MKPFSIHPASCSCTSCVYRSRSKEPRVRQIIHGGTEIDKLYYGKFLPLRERKLLEKLIRTRDVYDDVRNQLLSSTSSDQTSVEQTRNRRDDTSTGSAVLDMVDLVDRGHMGSANMSKFSSCCSCCSCEALRKIRKRMEKDRRKHKHPPVHRHIVTCEDIAKYCAEVEEKARKRRNKLSTKISSKFSSKLSTKIGATRVKIKKNLSEPCACTLSLSSMATRSSKAIKKLRLKKKARETAQPRKVLTMDQETKIAKPKKKPRKKVKNIQSSTTKDSGTEVGSLKAFKIKKDSILLFKEKLLKKKPYEENKDVECEPGICNPDECEPEECYKIIKAKGFGDTKKRKYHTRHSETGREKSHISMGSRTKKVKVRDSQVQDRSSHSLTTILKTKVMPLSKSEIKGKRPISPKQRQQLDKGTRKQDKAFKRTRSSASMTFVPKSKVKAQLAIEEKTAPKGKPKAKLQVMAKNKRLEDKGIRVQFSPQSNFGTCECLPSKRSTSSLTSVPKHKATKTRYKRIKSQEAAPPPIRHKRGRQKPTRESYQTVEEADLEEPIEHVKGKREKRIKPAHGRIEKQHKKHKHSSTKFIGTLSKSSQDSYLRETASQAKDLPFPRECEPLMCIPYECDPEKCAQILLSRSKSRGKSAMTSMDRLRRKSVGSAAFSQKTSQKTSSRSRTKSKHKQSKSAENFIRKPKYISKEPPPQIVEKCCYPDKQAVKISSSFSFNIEFYKDTYPRVEDNEKQELVSGHQKNIKQKRHRKKYKDHGTGYISSRQNISSQSRSSQSFKNIQVGHRLKRCFCTLKLLPKKKHKLKHAISKKTMATLHNNELDTPRRKRTQTKLSGIAYVVPPATSPQASLLPYECEPFFCNPGHCNPYECAERIKQRNRRVVRHVSKETNTSVTTRYSKLASTSESVSKSTSKDLCDCENKNIKHKGKHSQTNAECECKVSGDKLERHERRNIKHKRRHSPSSNVERKLSRDKSERQAVRIGSNFKFDIEFSKTNINDQEDALKSDKSIKKERRYLQEKGIKVHKPHVRHETSETNKYNKTKQTYTEPFLQRCLCTLKLLKKHKKKVETLSPWPKNDEYVMHMQKKSVTTNRAEIRYNPERSKFIPYEWEPSFCTPKEYDPFICEKLIKLRHLTLQNKYSHILSSDLGSRSTCSKTSRTVTSKFRNTQSFTNEFPQKVKKRNQGFNEINIIPSRTKQRVMRVECKSSLKMSSYKSKDNFTTTDDLINKTTHKKDKVNIIESQHFKRHAHLTSIDDEAKRKEKGSKVFSAIKRCFSTLMFQKKRDIEGLENHTAISDSTRTSYPLLNSQICEYKNNRKRLSKLPYGLSSDKCAPNLCIPEMRDSYECHEESKRREIKRVHNHYVTTDKRERKSVMSITTSDFSGSTMANSAQTRLLKHKTKKDRRVRDKQRDIKSARFFLPSRYARKGSNSSLNKIKTKNRLVPSIRDTITKNRVAKYNTISEISTVSGLPDKNTKNERVANDIGKEVKTSNVGFLLKRCFCTLGLQKKNKSKPEFTWQQPITTQFVQVEQNRHDITKSRCKVLNKTLYGEECVNLKLPERQHRFTKNIIGNQSAKRLPNSPSCSRRAHIRSEIDINFDKMRCLLKTQKINPFYRSFYALNVKVSKTKNLPHNKYRPLYDKGCKPGGCPANICDPDDCSKKVKRLKRSKAPDTISLDSQSSNKKGKDKPVTFGSDLSIRAGVYKDTDPYKTPRRRALRLGSDVRVNFDFFKEPPSRGICNTGPLTYHDRKEARPSHTRSTDIKSYGETQSKASGISQAIRKCFCISKLKSTTKNDMNQNRSETRTVKDKPRYKSTTQLSYKREKRERNLKSKSVQYQDYTVQQRKKSHRPTDRNNVTFCTNVHCLEYFNGRTEKQTKLNRGQGRGEGDVEEETGSIAEKKSVVNKCLCALKSKKSDKKKKDKKKDKKKKKKTFIDKCYCTLKNLKRQCQCKQLTSKQSMEIIGGDKKKFKQPDELERKMETIMPYSKKKFKKLDSQSKLAAKTNQDTIPSQPIKSDSKKKRKTPDDQVKLGPETNQDTIPSQPIKSDSKKKRKSPGVQLQLATGTNQLIVNQQAVCDTCKVHCKTFKFGSLKKMKGQPVPQGVCEKCRKPTGISGDGNTCLCPKNTTSFNCMCYQDSHVKGQCPVCSAIATGKFSKNKNLPCTCADPNAMTRAGARGGTAGRGGKGGKGSKAEPITPAGPIVDNTPLFEMTLNKTNMRIVNKDEVLKNLGASGKESKAMKKAQKAIKEGKVDPPVMKMLMDSGNASILNADQVLKQINHPIRQKRAKGIRANARTVPEPASYLQTEKSIKKKRAAMRKAHGSKCKCCICRGLKKGKQQPGLSMYTQKLRPCVCGSVLCKKDWDRIDHEQKSRAAVNIKKCVCGSNICDEESSKMPELLLEGARQAEHEKQMAKQAILKEKMYQKARKKRARDQKKALKMERKRTKKQDKREMKSILKSQHQGDISFMAESLIDLGTFGSKVFCDIARTLCRSAQHPREALMDAKEVANDPSAVAKTIQARAEGLGLYSTLSRIKQRMLRMPTAKAAITVLESNPTTNYLVHMADHDPKKRMKKFKTKREPLDFQCSIYMASMRKRPCLRVYYMCPWFYPHCMSLLNVWKQLMDILLFLSAVVVWSPCILCVEICRAFMCCFVCQG